MRGSSPDLQAAIAATRFGLGARPGEIAAAARDPHGWLLRQVGARAAAPEDVMPSSAEILRLYDEPADRGGGGMRQGGARLDEMERRRKAEYLAQLQQAAGTAAPFAERWTLFWANHFSVSATGRPGYYLAGSFMREAIRPNAFGSFAGLLSAAVRHPAMLHYLDQAGAAGPNSEVGRRRGRGLNENLARELLELHTVGREAGYTQDDVLETARALTGWTVGGWDDPVTHGRAVFREDRHEPGPRRVLGRFYAEGGEAQSRALLEDLAAHPRTARRLSHKIVRHFVADEPPAEVVAHLERAWLDSRGRLDAVAAALVSSPAAWAPPAAKFKAPFEYVVSTYRALGFVPDTADPAVGALIGLGQTPFRAPSPAGWPDDAAAWATPDALMKRLKWAERMSDGFAPDDARDAFAERALGGRASALTLKAARRALSRSEAAAVVMMSPEFQRR